MGGGGCNAALVIARRVFTSLSRSRIVEELHIRGRRGSGGFGGGGFRLSDAKDAYHYCLEVGGFVGRVLRMWGT